MERRTAKTAKNREEIYANLFLALLACLAVILLRCSLIIMTEIYFFLISFIAVLIILPNCLSFFRLSTYDIS